MHQQRTNECCDSRDNEYILPCDAVRDDLLVDQPCRDGWGGEENARCTIARDDERPDRSNEYAARICACKGHPRTREQCCSCSEHEHGGADEDERTTKCRTNPPVPLVHVTLLHYSKHFYFNTKINVVP